MPSLRPGGDDRHAGSLASPPFSPLGNSMMGPSPSLSSSPEPMEEDIATPATLWSDEVDDDYSSRKSLDPHGNNKRSSRVDRKGKGKAFLSISTPEVDLEAGTASDGELTPREANGPSSNYPPVAEEEEESRRVEENLRRWEQKERDRRRVARESGSGGYSSGIFEGLTRRTSLLWRGRQKPQAKSGGGGLHRTLNTSETQADADVPLEDIASPTPPPRPRSFLHPDMSDRSIQPRAASPFEPPPTSPSLQQSSFMDASSVPPTPKASARTRSLSDNNPFQDRPILEASSSFSKHRPPKPKPVDIPPPRSPPPRTETPAANRPPEPHPRPVIDYDPSDEPEEPLPETKWWTEWLCGCSEGPNRGGDSQAGRTNPFE